jgi:hypothetical protein
MALAGHNERRAEALEELAALARLFPLLRPQNSGFEEWVAEHTMRQPSADLIEEGMKWVARPERKRITQAHGEDYPLVWQSLVADVGDERRAGQEVLAGSVVAALAERRQLRAKGLELIEEHAELRNPALALSRVLRGAQVWSAAEAAEVDYRIVRIPPGLDEDAYERRLDETFARETKRNWSAAHERRLFILVNRVRAQLPAGGYPHASAVLAAACAVFTRDATVRQRVAAILLARTLDPPRFESGSSLAA